MCVVMLVWYVRVHVCDVCLCSRVHCVHVCGVCARACCEGENPSCKMRKKKKIAHEVQDNLESNFD